MDCQSFFLKSKGATMNWQDVCEDPILKDLPYKIELNEWGQIVMSPASNKHGFYQSVIIAHLGRYKEEGKVISECSVDTQKGVKVADVAWLSDEFIGQYNYETPYSKAPEICIEIISPSNTNAEMTEKMNLYFDEGAKEVWLCDENGNMMFYDQEGQLEHSTIIPTYPNVIEI